MKSLTAPVCRALNVSALSIDAWANLGKSPCSKSINLATTDPARIRVLSNSTCQVINITKLSPEQFSAFTDSCISSWKLCTGLNESNFAAMSDATFALLQHDCLITLQLPLLPLLNVNKTSHIMSEADGICFLWDAKKVAALRPEVFSALTVPCVKCWDYTNPLRPNSCKGLQPEAALYIQSAVWAEFPQGCLLHAPPPFLAHIPASAAAKLTARTFSGSGFAVLPYMSIPALHALTYDALRNMESFGWTLMSECVHPTESESTIADIRFADFKRGP